MHIRNEPVLFEVTETLGLLPQYSTAYPDTGPFYLPFPSRSRHFPPLSIQATRRPFLSLIWTTESCFPLRIFSMSILFFFLINLFIYLFIYFWLSWVFVSVRGLSPAVASGGHPSSWCVGLSLSRPLPLRSTGSRGAGSVVVAHRLSCSVACGIPPDQGPNPRPLHWQADSQPLRHQGRPMSILISHSSLLKVEIAFIPTNAPFIYFLCYRQLQLYAAVEASHAND